MNEIKINGTHLIKLIIKFIFLIFANLLLLVVVVAYYLLLLLLFIFCVLLYALLHNKHN